jgi:uncharacterized RDD family membrane protein YckC
MNWFYSPAGRSPGLVSDAELARLPVAYAGYWVRVAATVLDQLIAVAVFFLVFFAYFQAFPDFLLKGDAPGRLPMLCRWALILAIYDTIFIGTWGATPGKMLCKMRVVRPGGDRISYLRAFGRYFVKILGAVAFCISYANIASDPERRGPHDSICSTRVIHTPPSAEELVTFRY